ncbi:MAG: RNA polymerase sigma factor [Planctomycetota bacterium]|jgi:RNA polymerase sigma-70 factor (ECF subfamily)
MEVLSQSPAKEQLAADLMRLWERTGEQAFEKLAKGKAPREGLGEQSEAELLDWTSTILMDCYKRSGDSQVFGLLYELNQTSFTQAISYRLRRSSTSVDSRDVLQEVFLNIYRYPHRFNAEKADSFRNWGHRIVRNTLLKNLKGETKRSRLTTLEEDLGQRPDSRLRTPARIAEESENAVVADRAYLLYLNLYLVHFNKLSEKERRALTMVEVDGESYKAAAKALGIRLENLKMVIFRGRRKILRSMSRSLTRLEMLGATASTPRAHHEDL